MYDDSLATFWSTIESDNLATSRSKVRFSQNLWSWFGLDHFVHFRNLKAI